MKICSTNWDKVGVPLKKNDKHKGDNRENIISMIVKLEDSHLTIAIKYGTIHKTFQAHDVIQSLTINF